MRRLFGVVLAGAILILPAFSQSAFAQQGSHRLGRMQGAVFHLSPGVRRFEMRLVLQKLHGLRQRPLPGVELHIYHHSARLP